MILRPKVTKLLRIRLKKFVEMVPLIQWFPTGVPQRGVRGAAKFGSTAFLLMFYYIRCCQIVIFKQLVVPPNFFKDPKGAANQERLKNTALIQKIIRSAGQCFSLICHSPFTPRFLIIVGCAIWAVPCYTVGDVIWTGKQPR